MCPDFFSSMNDRSEEFSDTIQKEYNESAIWATFDSVWMAKQFEMEKLELSESSWIELSWGKYRVINYESRQFFEVCSAALNFHQVPLVLNLCLLEHVSNSHGFHILYRL